MSSTIKAQVLSKAIELWTDPKKRIRDDFEMDGAYCAMGVLRQAAFEIEGAYAFDPEHWKGDNDSGAERLAGYIGLTPERVIEINDDSRFGPKLMYRLMKRHFAKELT